MINNKHTLEFGANAAQLHSGSVSKESQSRRPVAMPAEQAAETCYISIIYKITQNLTIDGGFRYVLYSYLGGHCEPVSSGVFRCAG